MNYERKKRGDSVDLSTLVYGKVPPQSKDLEEAVLGALMIESKAIYAVVEYLEPDVFYVNAHQLIYKAILELHNSNMGIDILTVTDKLRSSEKLEQVGGAYFVTMLTNSVTSSAHLEEHCRIIIQMFIKREMIKIAGESIHNSYEDSTDCFDLIDNLKTKLTVLDKLIMKSKITNIDKLAVSIIEDLVNSVQLARDGKDDPSLVFTGLREWDRINGSLFNGLYVVAARPAMGKGVHLTECVATMAQRVPVGVINGEMTNKQLLVRIGCNLLGIDNYLWKKDKVLVTDQEIEQVKMAMEACINLKLLVTDEKDIDLISSKIRYWKYECGVKCVFIDFLTMLKVNEEKAKYWNDRQKINYILTVLTDLNRKCEIPIVLYAQLNRGLLQRASKEPNLGDLKESGSIEELAFQVSFLHRPEYYDESGVDELGESVKGLMYQIIAKHRDGVLDRIKYHAILKSSKLNTWYGGGIPSITQDNTPSWDSKNISIPYNNQIPRNVSGDDGWPSMDENDLI